MSSHKQTWIKHLLSEKQMSEAFVNSVFLALSGGFQDAYTYNTRDEVFSNAQTGNVVLMSQHFMNREWQIGLRYLFPLLAFVFGVFVAENVQNRFKYAKKNALAAGNFVGRNRDTRDCRIYSKCL